jgi:hypothetical protein
LRAFPGDAGGVVNTEDVRNADFVLCYHVLFPPYRSLFQYVHVSVMPLPFHYTQLEETIYSNDYVMLVAIVSCFSLLLVLRQLSLCFYVILVRSTSCFVDLFCLTYVARLYLVFSDCLLVLTVIVTCFSVYANVISDVCNDSFVGYKSREIFLSFWFFCTAYRAAQIVTTLQP